MFNPANNRHVAKHRLCGTGESGLSRGRPPTYSNPTEASLARQKVYTKYNAKRKQKNQNAVESLSAGKAEPVKQRSMLDTDNAMLSEQGEYLCETCNKPLGKAVNRNTSRTLRRKHKHCSGELLKVSEG